MQNGQIKVAVFDLNKTVYRKSSKDEFFKFVCYKRNYKLLNLLQLGFMQVLGKLKILSKTEFKENFFHYLKNLPPNKVKVYARQFWDIEWEEHFNEPLLEHIEQLRQDGVQIIFSTGGFDVYVAPLFEKHLKVDAWMATRTEYVGDTYRIKGKALKDEEKVRRLDEHFAGKPYTIVEAFSDEKENLFDKAEKAFLMKDGKPVPYK